jgi:hypothetical protein
LRLRYRLFVHPVESINQLSHHYRSALHDWYYRIETYEGGVHQPPDDSQCLPYYPTEPKLLRWVFRSLPIDFREYSFIDFGSGKGRVLVSAARYAFIQVIGVEYSSQLHEQALNNIRSARHLKCCKVRSICVDAAQFTIPKTPCVLYFYNPFKATIMERVLSNVRTSLMCFPRPLFIAYMNPVLHDFLICERGLRLWKSVDWCNLYVWSTF